MKSKKHEQKIVKKYREEGKSIRQIADLLGLTKYAVENLVREIGEPLKEAIRVNELLAPYKTEIMAWVTESRLTYKLIHKRLITKKVDVSESSLSRYIRSLQKPEVYVPVLSFPGEEAQIDFGYLGLFNKNGKQVKVWVFNIVLSFSRYAFYKIVTDQSTITFLQCHQEAFEFYGGVPKTVKIDNLGAGVLEADFYQPLIQQQYGDFLEHYGSTVITARICRGQDKGKVEAGVKYVKCNFLKDLKHRNYEQLVHDLKEWNKNICNLREHGTTRKIPHAEFIKKEKKYLQSLPQQRYEIYSYEDRKVNQYGHVYFQYNQYSVPHHYAGEMVRLASNKKVLKIYNGQQQIALHMIQEKPGQFITEDHHKPYHKRIKTSAHYFEMMKKIGEDAVLLLEKMITERHFEWKKMCNGIHRLSQVYNPRKVNLACAKALTAGLAEYRKVKEICETDLSEKIETKQVNGYAHDLRLYDQFVTHYTPSLNETF